MVLFLQVWEEFLLLGYEFVAVDAGEGVVLCLYQWRCLLNQRWILAVL